MERSCALQGLGVQIGLFVELLFLALLFVPGATQARSSSTASDKHNNGIV